jgi:hypothetical protein
MSALNIHKQFITYSWKAILLALGYPEQQDYDVEGV